MSIDSELKSIIRDVPNFPKKGIIFKDITPLLKANHLFNKVVNRISNKFSKSKIDIVAGIESRGFIIAAPVALKLKAGFVPIRKVGKLPYKKVCEEYELEYGTDKVEIHEDAIQNGQKVLIVDDLLATGGTALATARLIEKLGGNVTAVAFIVELGFLKGREKLEKHHYKVFSLVNYKSP